MESESLSVVACPNPFTHERIFTEIPEGGTISEILEIVQPNKVLRQMAHVWIAGHYIEKENWHLVRPNKGVRLTIRVVPQSTGGEDGGENQGRKMLRTVLLVVILIASIYFPPAYGLVGTQAAVATAFIATTGSLLLNHLLPPIFPNLDNISGDFDGSPTLFLAGARNRILKFGPVPQPLGKHRMVPPYGASPFTEIAGSDQFVRMLFVWGQGPLNITDIKIGETLITDFDDVEVETVQGFDADPPLTLFSNTVLEDTLQINLVPGGDWQLRTTPIDADEISIDISFVQGLFAHTNKGVKVSHAAAVDLQYRKVGDVPWLTIDSADILSKTWPDKWVLYDATDVRARGFDSSTSETVVSSDMVTTARLNVNPFTHILDLEFEGIFNISGVTRIWFVDRRTTGVRHNIVWKVPSGQYEVRIKYHTDYTPTDLFWINDDVWGLVAFSASAMIWTAIRTFETDPPINRIGLAMTAVRIKATNQLNGVVDTLNGVVESIVQDWDSGGSTWVERGSSNPASLFRHALQGASNARALVDSRVDLVSLQDWHEKNETNGYEFNMVIDFKNNVGDILNMIAAAGRATKARTEGKWGVVIDDEKTDIIQHFTPRNTWGYSSEKIFPDLPEGFRVRFVNEDKDWNQDERIVYDDGFNDANASKFESLELPGVTNPDQVWKGGRFHIAQLRLRPEVHKFSTDIQHLACTRGDLVVLAHDVPLVGVGSGRVIDVQDDATNVTDVQLDEFLTLDLSKSYNIRFRYPNGSSNLFPIDPIGGLVDTFTLSDPKPLIANGPMIGDLAMLGETGTEVSDLVVTDIRPGSDESALITCVDASPAIHTSDVGLIPDFDSNITLPLTADIPIVANIQSDEEVLVREGDGSLSPRLVVTFVTVPNKLIDSILNLETQFKLSRTSENWDSILQANDSAEVSITEVEQGEFYVTRHRYIFISGPGKWSPQFTTEVIGKSSPPPDVDDVTIRNGELIWMYPLIPLDFAGFEIRTQQSFNVFSESGGSGFTHPDIKQVWGDAEKATVGLITVTSFDLSKLKKGTQVILIKAIDTSGNESENPSWVVKDLGDPIVENVVLTQDEKALSFPGTVVNATIDGDSNLAADTDTTLLWTTNSGTAKWSGIDSILLWGGSSLNMSYTTTFLPRGTILPAKWSTTLGIDGVGISIEYRPDVESPLWNTALDTELLWTTVDATLMWQTRGEFLSWPGSLDNISRQVYDFRISIQGDRTNFGKISLMDFNEDVPDVIEYLNDISLPSEGDRLPINKSFNTILNVSLTLQESGTGATSVRYLDKNPLGPLVQAFDGTTPKTALIDATIQGY